MQGMQNIRRRHGRYLEDQIIWCWEWPGRGWRSSDLGVISKYTQLKNTKIYMLHLNSFILWAPFILPFMPKVSSLGLFCFFVFFPEMSLVSLADFKAHAQEHLSKLSWDFIEGEADEGITYNDNIAAFKRSSLYPFCCYSNMHCLRAPEMATVPVSAFREHSIHRKMAGFCVVSSWCGDKA